MDSRVTPPKRVTLPTCSPPPPCKQVLIQVYISTSVIFRPILALFTQFALHQFFHLCISPRGILFFLIPDDAADRGKLGIKFLSLISALKSLP